MQCQTGMERKKKQLMLKCFIYIFSPGIHFNEMLLVHILGQRK